MAPWFHFHDAPPRTRRRASPRWARWLRALLGLPLDWLAPPSCAACDQRLSREALFCGPCALSVEAAAHPSPTAAETPPLLAAGAYGGALAVAIQRYKYQGHSHLGRGLGRLIRGALRSSPAALEAFGASPDHGAVVMPVPLHPRQLAERGYNQATPLAAAVAAELELGLDCGALVRRRDTPHQARLDAAARRANVARAFAVARPERVRGRIVVLVDDVATTGATLASCAITLREAGAVDVRAVVLARAEPPSRA